MTDILNPTFLMCLGIILISIACLVIYFENKFRDQNHKMSSMLGLVTSLTEEVNNTKKFVSHMASKNESKNDSKNESTKNEIITHKLVEVSDDDDEDDDDEDDDDDDDDEDEDDDEDDDDNDNCGYDSDNKTVVCKRNKTKILKIDITPPNTLFSEVLNENLEEFNVMTNKTESDTESESGSESESEHVDEPEPVDEVELESVVELEKELSQINIDVKSIDINPLADSLLIPTTDYKKLSVQKLKLIVEEKGLVSDSSKMKKNDLVKLLETV